MKTTNICKRDVQEVADSLKIAASDELLERVLYEYDDYRKQYPTELWHEIVEIMLYDYTGPVLKYTPHKDDDVATNFLG